MTKEKKRADLSIWVLCILAALAFGSYLGSPVQKAWAQPVKEVMTVVSQQITEIGNIHKEGKEIQPAAENIILKNTTVGVTTTESADQPITESSIATESGIEVIVSEPPAEAQPEYICFNSNRGGAADRKEKDVLIHLINAEAYGLSYKAKVAVGQVVMNRWTGPYYGDDLLAIMTAPHQFTPIYNGSAYKKEIEPDSIEAANAVLSGAGVAELTDDTYYFVNPDFTEDKTIETKMDFVCEIEGIHFYKPPTS
ncbi:MAG TPA: cell wall hydrolase [Anaerovoracaceae bacterium]|nr:cell wall hydrolase [Anaerovoracaceae bacterium]